MNKGDLIKELADKTGATKVDVQAMLDSLMGIVTDSLKSGDKVTLPGLGILNIGKRAARKGINPKTKEKIDIPAKVTVKFKPAKELKDMLNGN